MNQYTTVGGTARTHDNNGNLTDDGTYLFGYDFQNRLVQLKNKSTKAVIATYRYDALGRRVEKAVSGGATTRYILDGVQVVEEYDGSNNWTARYVYEDGIDQPRSMDRADISDVNGNSNTTEVLRFHYHQQALGCVTEMTQPTGAVVEWVAYDVYGQPTIRDKGGTVVSQSAVGNPYLYTGREYDPESGLYFYRARYYDPGAGRFLQRDPWGTTDGLGLYLYVGSGPATYYDPLGRKKIPKPDRPQSTDTVKKTRQQLLGTEKKNGKYKDSYLQDLVDSKVITQGEADKLREFFTTPVGEAGQLPEGTALIRLGAIPTACRDGNAQNLDVDYTMAVTFWLVFVVDSGNERSDKRVEDHELGHVAIAIATAAKTGSFTAVATHNSSTDKKTTEKKVKKNVPVTNSVADMNGHQKEAATRVEDTREEAAVKDSNYDSPGMTNKSKNPDDLSPAQRKSLGLPESGRWRPERRK